ncbi:MAG: hypothetical protein Q3999_00275 [Buchananella hordeovulneris]|nr:hypothetical protein [Buchananella hordeovulneris]
MPYAEQVAAKQAGLEELLPSVPRWRSPQQSAPTRFRTTVKLVAGGSVQRPKLGIAGRDFAGIDLSRCPIVDERIEAALPAVKQTISRAGLVPYSVPRRRGELKNVLVTVSERGELMIRFVLRSTARLDALRAALSALLTALPQLRVVTANLLPTHVALPTGEEEIHLSGAASLPLPLGDVTLWAHPGAFLQTNTAVAAALYRRAGAWLAEQRPQHVVDLFCGMGGFALHAAAAIQRASLPPEVDDVPVAAPTARPDSAPATTGTGAKKGAAPGNVGQDKVKRGPGIEVVGMDVSAPSIASARRAAKQAGLAARFEVADLTRLVDLEVPAGAAVIVNPPRRGVGELMTRWLEDCAATTLVYSSCNPESLATDLARLPSWKPVEGQLFDMFPHTTHCEVAVLLRRI